MLSRLDVLRPEFKMRKKGEQKPRGLVKYSPTTRQYARFLAAAPSPSHTKTKAPHSAPQRDDRVRQVSRRVRRAGRALALRAVHFREHDRPQLARRHGRVARDRSDGPAVHGAAAHAHAAAEAPPQFQAHARRRRGLRRHAVPTRVPDAGTHCRALQCVCTVPPPTMPPPTPCTPQKQLRPPAAPAFSLAECSRLALPPAQVYPSWWWHPFTHLWGWHAVESTELGPALHGICATEGGAMCLSEQQWLTLSGGE